MKTGEDFKKQAELNNILEWPSHPCSICGVWVGYHFIDGNAYYKSACGCAGSGLNPRTWDDVAYSYNLQGNEKVIEEMNKFWGFETIKQ